MVTKSHEPLGSVDTPQEELGQDDWVWCDQTQQRERSLKKIEAGPCHSTRSLQETASARAFTWSRCFSTCRKDLADFSRLGQFRRIDRNPL